LILALRCGKNPEHSNAPWNEEEAWGATLWSIDAISIAILCVPLVNAESAFGRYWTFNLGHELLIMAGSVALYISIGSVTRGHDETGIFDFGFSRRLLVVSVGVTLATIATANTFARVSDFYSLKSLCFLTTSVYLVLTAFRTGILFLLDRMISSDRAYVFRALSVGICCDPPEPFEIARHTKNYVRTVDSYRFESVRDLVALSGIVAREKIDRVYVSSV
jgi:hypothetical protein